MAIQMFASIFIGSYESSLKVFEFSSKKKIRTVDHIRYRISLGDDVFDYGEIGLSKVDELCHIIGEFLKVIREYRITEFEAYAGRVISDSENEVFVLDQVYLRTGLRLKVLPNSERGFISYQSVAGRPLFEEMIQTSTAIIDAGGIGMQITIFKKGQMLTTQHLDFGTLTLRSLLAEGQTQRHYVAQIEEYIDKRLEVFRTMYLREKIEHIIYINDYGLEMVKKFEKNHKEDAAVPAEKFTKFSERLLQKNIEEVCRELGLSNEKDTLIIPSMALLRRMLFNFGPQDLWIPGLNVNDGIAYDYGRKKKLIKGGRDFDADLISASFQLARHYNSYTPHIEALSVLSTEIFDTMKKLHGLGKRERLLLKIASILHDCGKYISLAKSALSSYEIIMASELMGVTLREKEIVALIVLFNIESLQDYDYLIEHLPQADYLIVTKLSAILRVANALDQSHKQKFENLRVHAKERQLIFAVESIDDISLEQTLFETKTKYFESIFGIKPILKEKRVYHVK